MTTSISIVRAGDGVDAGLVQRLSEAIAAVFRIPCRVEEEVLDIAPSWDPDRRQYRADLILKALCDGMALCDAKAVGDDKALCDGKAVRDAKAVRDGRQGEGIRRLGVTAHDLFLPVLTHVFGAGQLTGRCAVVSFYRLKEEAYGLPPSQELLEERLLKESLHELGHTAGLRHCSVWQCVMSCSNGVELVDLKAARFCPHCHMTLQRVFGGHAPVT